MTPTQRNVLIALGSVVAVVGIVVLVLALRGDGGGGSRIATGPTGSTSTSTTGAGATTTSAPTSTTTTRPGATTTTTTTTSVASATTTAPTPRRVVTGQGAVLVAATGTADVRTLDPAQGCQSLADPGFTPTCGVAQAAGGELVWLTEQGPAGGSRAYLFRPAGGDQWAVALRAVDDTKSRWSGVAVKVMDLSGDGRDDIAYGFRDLGSASILELDVVDGTRRVVVHRSLGHGSARVSPGQLDTWSAEYPHGEPDCCPPSYAHDVVRYKDGAWRVVASASVVPADVPPSQF